MLGTISRCWLFVYKTPISDAKRFLPPQLEPVQYNNYSFWNVVVCQVKNMRPQLCLLPMGITYWHVAYRVYVRVRPRENENIEGLYFLRSDCNNSLISMVGNLLTDFNFHTAKVSVHENDQSINISIASQGSNDQAIINKVEQPLLLADSVFNSLDEASQFLKYKPNGISIQRDGLANITHIVRDEQAWQSKLVYVERAQWAYFKDKNVSFEICYEVEPIAYQWNRAKIYKCESF